jgi:hypothetical protein
MKHFKMLPIELFKMFHRPLGVFHSLTKEFFFKSLCIKCSFYLPLISHAIIIKVIAFVPLAQKIKLIYLVSYL